MSKKPISRKALNYSLCAGMLLAGHAFGQPTSGAQGANASGFNALDQNANQELEWLEIRAVYEDELREAGWDETFLMNEFDENQSGTIDMQEYVVIMSHMTTKPTTRQAALNERSRRGPDDQPVNEEAIGPQGQREDIALNAEQAPGRLDITVDTPETAPIGTATRLDSPDARTPDMGGGDDDIANQEPATDDSVIASLNDMSLGDIKQLPVINMNEQQVGQVKDVVRHQDGAEAGIVVSVDGSGEDTKDVFVDLDQFSVTKDAVVWQTPLDSEGLQELPEYNEALYVSIL